MNNNSLDALFTGLTGTQAKDTDSNKPDKHSSPTAEHDDSSRSQPTKQAEERFCTIVSSDLLHKIRVIAKREGLQIKDVVNAAFDKAVKSYERKYGVVETDIKRSAKNLF